MKDKLYQWYIIERKGTREIGQLLGVSQPTVCKILEQNGIRLRTYAENKTPIPKGGHLTESHRLAIGVALIGNRNNIDPITGKSKRYSRKIVRCSNCGKKLERKQCHLHAKRFWCDSKCCAQLRKGEDRGGKVAVQCETCGNPLIRQRCYVQQGKKFFCDQVCNGQWKAKYLVGEQCYNFEGGHEPYYGPSWPWAKIKARERDNNMCQLCGDTAKKLKRNSDVHHIRPFKKFGLVNHKKANALSNLVCYCNKCHKIIEEVLKTSV